MKKWFLWFVLFSMLFSTRVLATTTDETLGQAVSLYQQGQYAQAVSLYQSAIQTDSKSWRLYQGLGSCLYQLGRLPEASRAYDQSLSLYPNNSSLKAFADSLRARVGTATPVPTLVSSQTKTNPGTVTSNAESNPEFSMDEQQAVSDFKKGKALEEKGRDDLKKYGEDHPLSLDDEYIARWGAPKSKFFEPHFTLDWGVLTPTIANVDLGFFLDPTTNLGIAFLYVPLPQTYYEYDESTFEDVPVSSPGDMVYIEPRIKFYSAPSGLSTYQGFSLIYYGLHQGLNDEGDEGTNFDLFGVGYLFGFRTLPMDGMTMEIGWKMGIAVISVTNETDTYNSSTDEYTEEPTKTVVPFPYIIPEFRFGFTF